MSELGVGLVVRCVAKPGKEQEVGSFLSGALPMAQSEAFTPVWFALKTAPNVFYVVDAFASDVERNQHLTGEIAKALLDNASTLLAEPPRIEKADVLGAKVVA